MGIRKFEVVTKCQLLLRRLKFLHFSYLKFSIFFFQNSDAVLESSTDILG